MPKDLAKATAYDNNIATWADWRNLVAQVTAAGFSYLVAQYEPPEGAGRRKIDKATAKLRAAFAARPDAVSQSPPRPSARAPARTYPWSAVSHPPLWLADSGREPRLSSFLAPVLRGMKREELARKLRLGPPLNISRIQAWI